MKITGYSDKISVRPGETLQFMVSCELPKYTAEVVRIICGDTNPAGPGVKEKVIKTAVSGTYKGRKQVIEAGSHVVIPTNPVLEQLESFSVQAMLWPTTPEKGRQVLMAKFSEPEQAGFALMIAEDGSLALLLATSQGGHTDVYLVVCEELLVTIPGLGGTENELVRADMVFYETPNGGAVWSASSIAWAGGLSHNRYKNNVSRLTKNVLDRFLDPQPFVVEATTA